MKTVWKFKLDCGGGWQMRTMPEGAVVLHVDAQNREPDSFGLAADRDYCVCLWALVDSEAGPENRCFAVVGTGHPVPEISSRPVAPVHRGTALMCDGALVWHVFEFVEAPAGAGARNAGQRGSVMDAAASPQRAHRLVADIGADTKEDLVRALHATAEHIARDELTTGCIGSPNWGMTYSHKVDPDQTHDRYFQQIEALLNPVSEGAASPSGGES